MPSGPLVILAAAASEAAAIRRALPERARRRMAAGPCWEAAGGSVAVVQGGVGMARAAAAARAVLESLRPAALLHLGFAGALRPDLAAGALVLAERTRPAGPDGPDVTTVPADAGLLAAAERAGAAAGIRVVGGTLVTTSALVASPADKAALAAATGAAAVDMEAGAAATVAARAAVPFLAAKVIFDAAHEALHPRLAEMVRPDGSPRILYAACLAARDPELRAALHWAGRRARASGFILTRLCRALLAAPRLDAARPFP